MTLDPITLHVDAAVRITDSRGVTVGADNAAQALATMRSGRRHAGFTVEVSTGEDAGEPLSSEHRQWAINDEGEASPVENGVPDYTLTYRDFTITDSAGVPRKIRPERIAAVSQNFADRAQNPVIVSSELLSFESLEFQPAPLETPGTDEDEGPAEQEDTDPAHDEVAEPVDDLDTDEDELSLSAELLDDPAPIEEETPAQEEPEPAPESESDEDTPQPAPQRLSSGSSAYDFATRRSANVDRLAPAEMGWRGGANRFFLTKLKPGAAEREYREQRAMIQRGLDGHRTVAMLNIKGGVGKSTSTFLVGATLGRIRGGHVLAWDNNENSGNLADRGAAANHSNTAIDLYEQIGHLNSVEHADKLVRYVRPQGDDRFDVLASQTEAADKETIDADAFRTMHRTLSTFYSQIVVDTGNASTAKTWQAAVDVADVLTIVATNKEDGARRAFKTIDALHKQGHTKKLSNSVAIINQPRKPSKKRLADLKEGLAQHVREVVVIPWDASLDEGETITWELLYPETRTAVLRATAAIVEGL